MSIDKQKMDDGGDKIQETRCRELRIDTDVYRDERRYRTQEAGCKIH